MRLWIAVFLAGLGTAARAETTINPDHAHAWGANVGWINWRGDPAQGAQVGEFFCSGYLYAANVGWIHLGSGRPADGRAYQNNSATDYGVNVSPNGDLRGFAYGANIGWVRFPDLGAPSVDPFTGKLSGAVYGANIGWISLSNAVAYVQTDRLTTGDDTDHDNLPDAWELSRTNNLTRLGTGDADGDGVSDLDEYLADTDPLNTDDRPELLSILRQDGGAMITLEWTSRPTRKYQVQRRAAFEATAPWQDVGLQLENPDAGVTTTRSYAEPAGAQDFFRVRIIKPLSP